ncbi:hypothetical protein A8709_09930 [Paenibacillus pectinilyticus]|uniref:SLH domain-containing protein n=1 Tax=Paenibacillus pectinilyticus TaxID=512399 RepID=A0A1C1A5U1_9BACL|nr:S-layer homology domain-containing protein [Paenibacillus pectinilyticus]OCT15932.1 hypothetical protein A8709_09930 [Paenibacillus pectinilyticus]
MQSNRSITKGLMQRVSAAIALLFVLNIFIPIIASATSLFNLQYDSVSGKVYGYIYSDKPSLSVGLNDETFGMQIAYSNLQYTNRENNNDYYYYDLNEIESNENKGLKPVTAVVYEDSNMSAPVFSSSNDVTNDVYTYNTGAIPILSAPTDLHASIYHGYWIINYSLSDYTFLGGVNVYLDGKQVGTVPGRQNQYSMPYTFNQPTEHIQMKTFNLLGIESPLSETLTLVFDAVPDAYHYQGRVYTNGYASDNTKFDIKDANGQIVESFTYHGQEIKGDTLLGNGHYEIKQNSSDIDYGGKHLAYYFDLPSNDYSISVTNSANKQFQVQSYSTNYAGYTEYEGLYSYVYQLDVYMYGTFKEAPVLFTDKEAGHWFAPNEELVAFTPSQNTGGRLDIQFPYDMFPYQGVGSHNTTTLDTENMTGSDFQVTKVSDGSNISIKSVFVGQPDFRPSGLSLVLDKTLVAGEKYVLKMSSSSGANEIRLPLWPSEKFNMAISLSIASDKYDIFGGRLIDDYLETQTVNILPTGTVTAVAAVTAKITALPAVTNLVKEDETAVNAAKAAFDLLTPAQKALVTTADQTKLSDALAKIAALKTPPPGLGFAFPMNNSPQASEDGATINTSMNTTKEKGADGKEFSRVKLDSDVFTKALDVIKGNDKNHQVITLDGKGTEAGAKLDIPAASLIEAWKANSNITIAIQSDAGTYQVPVSIFKDIAKQVNKDLKDVNVTISVTKASEKSYEALQQANPGMKTLLANPIEFTITAVSGSTKVEINDFSGTYVERTIVVPSTVDGDKTTVVSFDPVTGKMTFIPAIVSHVKGSTEITIKSPHNSMYTLVELNKSFNDISTHWAKADIELLASKFIVQGMNEASFAPEQHVTRAQFASMLVSALAVPQDAKSSSFVDVKKDDWFAGAVGTAAKLGLVEGNSAGEFLPNADITREQMAVMISRALKISGKEAQSVQQDKLSSFTDNGAISDWAKTAIAQSLAAGIVNGLSEQTFAPQENATRAQATVMLKRFLQYVDFIN